MCEVALGQLGLAVNRVHDLELSVAAGDAKPVEPAEEVRGPLLVAEQLQRVTVGSAGADEPLEQARGTRILALKTRRVEVPLEVLLRNLEKRPPHLVPGTAVFLTSDPQSAPTAHKPPHGWPAGP